MKKLLISIVTSLILISGIHAQNKIDLAGVSFYYNPKVGLREAPGQEFDDLKYNVSEIKAFVLVPFQLKNQRTMLITGAKWHFVNAPFDNFPSGKSFNVNLHSFQVNLGIDQKFSEKWGGVVMLRPTLASNFRGGISGEDFYLQGSVALHRRFSEKLRIGAGVGNTIGFGEPKTVVVLLVDYNTEKFSLKVNAPAMLDLKFTSRKMQYGFKAELEGGQYHLSNLKGDGPVVAELSAIKFSRYNVGPTLGWNLEGEMRMEISAGYSLNRILKTLDPEGVETNYDLKPGGFLRIGFFLGRNK